MKNYYAIRLDDFMEAKKALNNPLFWCLLKDRIHLEYPIENAIFVSQAFLASIKESNGNDFDGDPIDLFIKQHIKDKTPNYRFYPTKEQVEHIKAIKLYDELKTIEIKEMEIKDPTKIKITEDDYEIKTYNDGQLYMRMKKVDKI